MFQLVFKGECTPGTDPEVARANAKNLFKANAGQVAKMFSGQAVVIRNQLEEVQAEKYRAVLHKHGMIAYVESMEGTRVPESSPDPEPDARQEAAASPQASADVQPPTHVAESPSVGPVRVEPGDRPNVAGEKVDTILSGSGLTLDPVGITLEEHKEAEPPMFQHLDEWTLAPPGVELVEARKTSPPVVPDISHLSLADEDEESGSRS